MTVVGLFAGLLTICCAGFGCALLCVGTKTSFHFIELCALSWLIGSGVISLFLWGGGFLLSGVALQSAVSLLAVALAVIGWSRARRTGAKVEFSLPTSVWERLLGTIIAFEIVVMIYVSFKHGLGWDGLLNWEMKARYAFFHEGVLPAEYFASSSRAFSHAEYPLFLPMAELWLYLWMGEPNQFWIKLIFPLFYAAGVCLLTLAVGHITKWRWPGLVVAALLFFVPFLTNSPGGVIVGYADLPLSVFYLGAVAYLLMFWCGGNVDHYRLFAVLLALLPWIKREGVILWLVAAVAGAIVVLRRKQKLGALAWLLPGPVLTILHKLYLMAMNATSPTDFLPFTFETALSNLKRFSQIGAVLLSEICEIGRWSIFWGMVGVSIVFLLVHRRDLFISLLLAWTVLGPVVFYASTYVFSAWSDLSIHMASSFPRLLLHVMPIGWLIIALAMHYSLDRGGRLSPQAA